MKIEQIDENQIRCTLTKDDLTRRNMRLSELAYGTEKARGLFQDMMRQATLQFGFDPGDVPIMVEAVPMNAECLVLVITKVEDPEELDTRFANFTPSLDVNADAYSYDYEEDAEEDFFSVFSRIRESSFADFAPNGTQRFTERTGTKEKAAQTNADALAVFSFSSLHEVTSVAQVIAPVYHGENALYADEANERYLLLLHAEKEHPEQFLKVCARLTEYGKDEQLSFHGTDTCESYLEEHFPKVIADCAVQKLRSI